jgi:glucan-binding YG repeat protein
MPPFFLAIISLLRSVTNRLTVLLIFLLLGLAFSAPSYAIGPQEVKRKQIEARKKAEKAARIKENRSVETQRQAKNKTIIESKRKKEHTFSQKSVTSNNEKISENSKKQTSNTVKSRNAPPAPLREAQGRSHTIIEKRGEKGQYTTHYSDGTWKQYRGSGKDHGIYPRPNVKETTTNKTADGRVFVDRGRVRQVRPDEIPRERK